MRPTQTLIAIAAALACQLAPAQTDAGALREVVQRAIDTNPEVTARLNALRASTDAVDVARGGWYPHLNLDASSGRVDDDITSRKPPVQNYSVSGASLSLNQLIWDGLATYKDVTRLGHDKLARYFELQDITEQTALEAVRAHQDVARFRELVLLAEDNYVQHRYLYGQLGSRYKAGVGRGVDLEQAAARLALAESNLTTETANLHDVTARYLRVVGSQPPNPGAPVELMVMTLPTNAEDAITVALRDNAAISASIENLRSARANSQTKESAFQPRVEARLRSGTGHNFDTVIDQKRYTSGEVVLNWNLFNGGSDQARVRQSVNQLNQAADQRDKACRDTRQNAGIAYNDTRKQVEQIGALERNVAAIGKTREGYRQQFEIGQRSLLDLLNSEDEYYSAKRQLANAKADLRIAQARTLATMQRLVVQLGLLRAPTGVDDSAWNAGEDGAERCPATVAAVSTTPRAELDARAEKLIQAAPPLAPRKAP